MKTILILMLILNSKITYSQVDYLFLKDKISDNLALLESYCCPISDFYILHELDADSIAEKTAEMLVKLLSKRESLELKNDPPDNLEFITSYGDSLVRLFVFSYNTGGSMGLNFYPVIQWKGNDGTFKAYNLSRISHSYIDKIYKLESKNSEFYLMLGGNRENQSAFRVTAYVINFLDDELILDYPAFYGSHFIGLTNMDMKFIEEDQVLEITNWSGWVEESIRYYPQYIFNDLLECFYTVRVNEYSQKQVCRLIFKEELFKPE